MDILVFGACVCAAVLVAAWAVSPGFRQWAERPKFEFQRHLNESKK